MSTLIRTDNLPAADRFAYWREVVSATWVLMECHSDHEAAFLVRMRCIHLAGVQVNLMTAQAHEVRRTTRLIRRSDPDMLKLAMPLRATGTCVVAQDGRQADLRPGEFALYDTRRPYVAAVRNASGLAQALTVMFPRALLPLPPHQLREVTAVRMPANRGIGMLTSRFLVELGAGIDTCRPAEAVRLATAALEVLAARLAHELDGGASLPPETHKRALLTRILAFIQQHLADPDLSPRTIASAHHVSIRYLHKLFQEQGATVGGWIRGRRLERCRRDLADPALASRPAASIGARWGFSNASHFGHVFRAAYGMPPQAYRDWALTGGAGGVPETVHGSETAVR
jgi:AraC-like DNA-binding protein